jgi:hypothetical protein
MAIPSVNLFANQPGGGLTYARGGINALANNRALRKYNEAKGEYAPMSLRAEAASKLAYANLMAPQFLAKAMQDPYFMGNLSEEQKAMVKNLVYNAGTGQGTGNAVAQLPNAPQQNQSHSGSFINALKNIFGIGNPQQTMPQQGSNAINMPPQQAQVQPQQQQPQQNTVPIQNNGESFAQVQGSAVDDKGRPVDNNGRPIPEPTAEELQSLDDFSKGNPPIKMTVNTGNKAPIKPGTYAKKGGEFQGKFEEEKEMGKIRAKQRGELDNQVEQAIASEAPVKHLGEIIKNPMFQNMRKFPWFQKQQLGIKATNGSREEQKLIGDFQTTAMKAVAETIKSFGGRILDKEVTLANDMKISPNDTIGVIIGKYPSIVAFNEMTKQRASIASKIMKEEGASKGEALQRADKQVNGEAIRDRVEKDIEGYPSREDIEHTAKVRNISPEEVIKRLKAAGKYHA